ncbi:element excision factor XisI family protein [Microcoleus sp.]
MFYLDIKSGQIWIQRNKTDSQIA